MQGHVLYNIVPKMTDTTNKKERAHEETAKPELELTESVVANDNNNDDDDEVLENKMENQDEPTHVTTNLLHSINVVEAHKHKDYGGAKGHDEDEQAKKVKQKRQRFHVDHLKDLFENEMDAGYVPYNETNAEVVKRFCSKMHEDDQPFYIVNLSHFARQYYQWIHYLARVKPFFAVKSNPSAFIIKILGHIGAGFDCASVDELDLVLSTCSNIDCGKRIIYAHPCKPISHMKYFRDKGVEMTVVDNEDELHKLKEHWPNAKVLVRLKTNDSHSKSPFSTKFGANECEIRRLLTLAKQLDIHLVGCSFHVGSRCYDINVYKEALEFARKIFDIVHDEEYGFQFSIIDIGGGFTGHNWDKPSFPEVAQSIHEMINKLFPEKKGYQLMAEPGRYFSSGDTILVCSIIARRLHNKEYSSKEEISEAQKEKTKEKALIESAENIYYINDGIYGTFNAIVFDHKVFIVHYLTKSNDKQIPEQYKSVIFGPTCDSIDCIAHSIDLPLLNVGDRLWFPDVGSYTNASASSFNGFKTKKYFFIWRN
ncbi:unnamed protein product [Didymodactylos carnosus]|uniref:ornithine decarboxylase n=1 Tax=Didymodactylos carnosus TaxID=1234261 RepID=A0A814IW42_9BILA|nr:unnamed protein product [Didymodactylos carnosus]CAF3799787.1 unnamed protein product [Didymodactylos carnosus]